MRSLGRLAVGLCTYKRPAGLARALAHVAASMAEAGPGGQIIVIDNDGMDPGIAGIVEAARLAGGIPIDLVVELQPGISAARNAMIAHADRRDIALLAMLDDDEWPAIAWLDALLARREQTGADVVGGPVRPDFGKARARMDRHARFWAVEPQQLDGKPFVFCTCNCLIDLDATRAVTRPLFDETLGMGGSEDTVLFRRLFHLGHAMAWAESAVMHEEVPEDRATISWLRRRRFAAGGQAVAWEARDRGRLRTAAKTIGMTARLAVYPLVGADPGLLGWLLQWDRLRGRFAAHIGLGQVQAYARSTASTPDAVLKACR